MLGAVSLTGKTALVTGAAKRLGCATAMALASEGVQVVVHYGASETEAHDLVEDLREYGTNAWAIAADLADPAQVEVLFDKAVEVAGPIDFLINNASIFPESHLSDVTQADVFSSVAVNALAPLSLARRLAAQGREGAVINFLDCRIVDYDREHVAYHLSKRMLASLTRMLAVEFAPLAQVNAVAPGLILPPDGLGEDYLTGLAHTNPLNRHGDAYEITRAVLFLLQSRFITGQVIYVDGGRHMKGRFYE